MLLFNLSQSTLWPSKIHNHPMCKMHSPHLSVALSLNPLKYQLQSKISCNCHQLKSQISSSKSYKSGVGETLGMIKHEENFLSIYRPVKQENMFSTSKIQWWGRHRITGMHIPIPKKRK